MRSEDLVIYDTYVNPQIKTTKLKDICNTLFNNNILYLFSYPSMDFFALTRPWSQPREDSFNYAFYKKYYQFLERIWMCSGEENLERMPREFNIFELSHELEEKSCFLYRLETKIKRLCFSRKDLRLIQKGYLGIGMNYFTGAKT